MRIVVYEFIYRFETFSHKNRTRGYVSRIYNL